MRTILLVEDEKMIRRGFKKTIQMSGIPVEAILECDNGLQALEILREHPVDVMFTDIQMPGMDGIELVRRVNQMDNRPVIVAVSGYDDFTYAVEMLRSGVKEYLLKPVGVDQILAILKKLDEELKSNARQEHERRQVSRRRLRTFLSRSDAAPVTSVRNAEGGQDFHNDGYDPEFAQFVEDNQENFLEGEYRVCVFARDMQIESRDFLILLDDVEDGRVCILEEEHLQPFLRNEAADTCVGISGVRDRMEDLLRAYRDSVSDMPYTLRKWRKSAYRPHWWKRMRIFWKRAAIPGASI